jgi:uncharacterized protein YeaO (DUF488 family)
MSFEACAQQYGEYLRAHPDVVDELLQIVDVHPTALLCYEASAEQCHRSVLVEALLEQRCLDVVNL